MTVSKKSILEIDAYAGGFEYEDFCVALGELVKQRFKSGYVKCSAYNMGWRNLNGHKVFECDIDEDSERVGRSFLNSFVPNCDWSASVYSLNRGKGLYFCLSTHDSPTGESYYLTPISERTYDRLS